MHLVLGEMLREWTEAKAQWIMRQRRQIVEGEHIKVQLQVTGEQEGLPRPESQALVEIQLALRCTCATSEIGWPRGASGK